MTDNQKCSATRRDGESCNAWSVSGESRCRMHLGKTVDGSSHEGIANAQKHALHADRGKFYERLDDIKQEQVDRFEAALIERYREYHSRDPDPADVKDLFEIAVGYVLRDYAREYMVEEMEKSGNPMLEHIEMRKGGEDIEFDKPNAILEQIESSRREDRMARKDKGLEKDLVSQTADSLASLADVWREALDEYDVDE